jgi:hypothetical protein
LPDAAALAAAAAFEIASFRQLGSAEFSSGFEFAEANSHCIRITWGTYLRNKNTKIS